MLLFRAWVFHITDLDLVLFLCVCLLNGAGTSVKKHLISQRSVILLSFFFQHSRWGAFVSKVSYVPADLFFYSKLRHYILMTVSITLTLWHLFLPYFEGSYRYFMSFLKLTCQVSWKTVYTIYSNTHILDKILYFVFLLSYAIVDKSLKLPNSWF